MDKRNSAKPHGEKIRRNPRGTESERDYAGLRSCARPPAVRLVNRCSMRDGGTALRKFGVSRLTFREAALNV